MAASHLGAEAAGGVHRNCKGNSGKPENIAEVCISCLKNCNFMFTQL